MKEEEEREGDEDNGADRRTVIARTSNTSTRTTKDDHMSHPKTKNKKGGRQKEDHSPKTRKIKDLKKAVSFAFNANVPFLI